MTKRKRVTDLYHDKHYCRDCTFVIPVTPTKPSAHFLMIQHVRTQHPKTFTTTSCSRYCVHREQTLEQEHSVKLYGPGSSRVTTLLHPYEDVFNDDIQEQPS